MQRLFLVAACFLGLMAAVLGQQCADGLYADAEGCCPILINNLAFYRDSMGCYPIEIGASAFYADSRGCYPDEQVTWYTLNPKIAHSTTYIPNFRVSTSL